MRIVSSNNCLGIPFSTLHTTIQAWRPIQVSWHGNANRKGNLGAEAIGKVRAEWVDEVNSAIHIHSHLINMFCYAGSLLRPCAFWANSIFYLHSQMLPYSIQRQPTFLWTLTTQLAYCAVKIAHKMAGQPQRPPEPKQKILAKQSWVITIVHLIACEKTANVYI